MEWLGTEAGGSDLVRLRRALAGPGPDGGGAADDGSLRIVSSAGRIAEAREVAREIATLLDAGKKPSSIAVPLLDPEGSASLVEEALERAGIPFRRSDGRPLAAEPEGLAALALVSLARDREEPTAPRPGGPIGAPRLPRGAVSGSFQWFHRGRPSDSARPPTGSGSSPAGNRSRPTPGSWPESTRGNRGWRRGKREGAPTCWPRSTDCGGWFAGSPATSPRRPPGRARRTSGGSSGGSKTGSPTRPRGSGSSRRSADSPRSGSSSPRRRSSPRPGTSCCDWSRRRSSAPRSATRPVSDGAESS